MTELPEFSGLRSRPFRFQILPFRFASVTKSNSNFLPLPISFCLCIAFLAPSAGGEEAPDFSDVIQPILSENCFHCHGPDEKERKAKLRLDVAEEAKSVTGDLAESPLLQRILSDDPDEIMPPPKSKLVLSAAEKRALEKWIASGANYEEHWAFVKPERPPVPANQSQGKNPIDAFVGQKLESAGLDFSPEAEPWQLIRRVTLDLTGLPPAPEEVDSFLADHKKRGLDAAYSALVDRLLDSPRFGENMALPWLDAARYADTDGYQFDGPRFMWRWRDWVINAYNSKMTFDRFTIEQLAGDLLPDPALDQLIATGFNRNHRYNSEAGLVVEEFLLENAVDRVDTTATLWMGLTMGCARCHDHKYDPFSQKDYYQLIAFFNSVPEAGRAVKSDNSEPVVVAPTSEEAPVLELLEKRLAEKRAALAPAGSPQEGGLLVDRALLHHFPLDKTPGDKSKFKSEGGDLIFSQNALRLNGKTQVKIGGLNKSFTLKTNSKFTLSFWIKPASTGDGIILSRQKSGTTRPGIELALVKGGRLQFDLISRWVAGNGRAVSKSPLPVNQWTHVAVSNDGSQSANGQLIFINGQLAAAEVSHNTNSNIGGVTPDVDLVIGGGIRPRSKKFHGAIRDLRIYLTDLWPEEFELLAAPRGAEKRKRFSRTKTTPAYPAYVKAREDLEKYTGMLPTVMVMKDTAVPKATYIRNRGVYDDYGEKVERGVPEKFFPMDEALPRNRLGFAKWLLSPEHPLTARVAVNRYWQKYFGTGLVKTAEDFGVQGEAPSHPELLDWLAVQFRESGWDIAAMQKLIVTSRTYRQSSKITKQHLKTDPQNRLLARFPRLRLTGHAIRDQALFVSGLLRERVGGPSVSPYQPANLWAEMSMGMKYRQSKGDDLYRRSLYTIWKRTVAPPAMAVFDSADREACWVSRKETNTPLQALTLLNETGFVESARHLAVKMIQNGGDDPLGYGFRCVAARKMTQRERLIFQQALDDYRLQFANDSAGAKKLINVGESPPRQIDKNLSAEEIAAFTAVANVLLNLDEVITRE